ncbi:MAG TPA: hypothetical protein ENJ49_01505 [Candidatus Moranbacteria bacterium]|nr:hypothetical protein [Candidatus Moranbacteria bacterium]
MTRNIFTTKFYIKLGVNSLLFLAILFFISPSRVYAQEVVADNAGNDEVVQDLNLFNRYNKYLKYKKYKKYKLYKKYRKKYAFKNSAERISYRTKYKLYKKTKNPVYYKEYKRYKKYKNKYKPLKKYAKYKKYKKYGRSRNGRYGKSKYKKGYQRYKNYLKLTKDLGEANLGGGIYGPEITIGLWSYSRSDLRETPFKIKANKNYNIKNSKGEIIGQIAANTITRVTYDKDGKLRIYNSVAPVLSNKKVSFDATDGNNLNLIFDIYKPNSPFDRYRGKIKLRYNKAGKRIWVINTLPLEQYIWGIGEITGNGDADYNRVMTTSFRTYGYWKLKFSTKYATAGFKVNATPGNQLYYGYDWEIAHPQIKDAADDTRGKIVMYKSKIALTPYSSWTDGKTRSFKKRWGSDKYPWCKSVADPYGKHPTKSSKTLFAEGNHMVGLSAHGALSLAKDHNWDWKKILKYYYSGIDIRKVY